MKCFKILYLLFLPLFCVLLTSCALNFCEMPDEKYYTTYNIWYGRRTNVLDALNYKHGNILPVGTEVKVYRCGTRNKKRAGLTNDLLPLYHLDFQPINAVVKKDFRIFLNRATYPGVTIKQFTDRLLSTEKFNNSEKKYSELEINAIKQGIIVPGMSKDAVLVSFGYPSPVDTPDLGSNIWVYWEGFSKKFIVEFDSKGLTISKINFNK